jgi:hypothetical protein
MSLNSRLNIDFWHRYGMPGLRTIEQLLGLRQLGYGEKENDLYYADITGNGYQTKEDYDKGQNVMVKEADGYYYPRQYGP